MTLQNRVTPFGEIVATPERGLFTGNRGIIHDPATKTLLARRWTTPRWLVCVCDFRGRRREVMGGRSWTELFFLDEATALAAGHRPCFFCRRDAAERFRAAWAAGNGGALPNADAMDAVLHAERLERRRKRLHALPAPLAALPDGAMVAAGPAAFVVVAGRAFRWSASGYGADAQAFPAGRRSPHPAASAGARLRGDDAIALLTPPSILRVLAAGYRPVLHPTVREACAPG